MARYTVRRLLQAIPVLLGVATITFFLIEAMPGDPVQTMLGPSPSQRMVEELRAKFGLDEPVHVRYVKYLWNALHGEFGTSLHYKVPATQKIIERAPKTLLLVLSGFAFALVTAIPLGVISAKRRNKPTDHVSRIVSLIGVSTPSFWIGLLLIIFFAYHLGWMPVSGLILPWTPPSSEQIALNYKFLDGIPIPIINENPKQATTWLDVWIGSLHHLTMPMVSLGTLQMAAITRIERSTMLEVLNKEYVKLARAYGVAESKISRKHAFRNAQLPVITLVGLNLSGALGGAVLTETVFNINGMGRLIIQSINRRDIPLVMSTTLMLSFMFVVGVIITDISYAYIDPRVSYGDGD